MIKKKKHWTTKKNKGEVGVTDAGPNKMYRNDQKKESLNTLNPYFPPKQRANWCVDSLKHTAIWKGELQPHYIDSQMTDCSQLREIITGAPNSI